METEDGFNKPKSIPSGRARDNGAREMLLHPSGVTMMFVCVFLNFNPGSAVCGGLSCTSDNLVTETKMDTKK